MFEILASILLISPLCLPLWLLLIATGRAVTGRWVWINIWGKIEEETLDSPRQGSDSPGRGVWGRLDRRDAEGGHLSLTLG